MTWYPDIDIRGTFLLVLCVPRARAGATAGFAWRAAANGAHTNVSHADSAGTHARSNVQCNGSNSLWPCHRPQSYSFFSVTSALLPGLMWHHTLWRRPREGNASGMEMVQITSHDSKLGP